MLAIKQLFPIKQFFLKNLHYIVLILDHVEKNMPKLFAFGLNTQFYGQSNLIDWRVAWNTYVKSVHSTYCTIGVKRIPLIFRIIDHEKWSIVMFIAKTVNSHNLTLEPNCSENVPYFTLTICLIGLCTFCSFLWYGI